VCGVRVSRLHVNDAQFSFATKILPSPFDFTFLPPVPFPLSALLCSAPRGRNIVYFFRVVWKLHKQCPDNVLALRSPPRPSPPPLAQPSLAVSGTATQKSHRAENNDNTCQQTYVNLKRACREVLGLYPDWANDMIPVSALWGGRVWRDGCLTDVGREMSEVSPCCVSM